MTSLAVPLPSMGAYSILLAPVVSQALARVPLLVRGRIRRRLNELALVADALRSNAADEITSTLHFEVAGYAVSYVVSDARRTLTVLSVARV